MSYDEDDYLMLSGIQHFSFCRRQWALIHLEQVWTDDARTAAGTVFHENVDERSKEKRGDVITMRAVRVSSPSLGLSGRCDVVELHRAPDGVSIDGRDGKFEVVPVEYKVGHRKLGDWDRIQLCAEAIALEESLHTAVCRGYLFYGSERRREIVEIDDALRLKTIGLAEEMHRTAKSGRIPKAEPSPACKRCSISGSCMPEVGSSRNVESYIRKMEEA